MVGGVEVDFSFLNKQIERLKICVETYYIAIC